MELKPKGYINGFKHEVIKRVYKWVKHEVTKRVYKQVKHEVTKRVYKRVKHEVTKRVYKWVKHEVTKRVHKRVKHEVIKRVRMLINTGLNNINLERAVIEKVIPVAAYPMNVCRFSNRELKELDQVLQWEKRDQVTYWESKEMMKGCI